jgi:hypothetical protein
MHFRRGTRRATQSLPQDAVDARRTDIPLRIVRAKVTLAELTPARGAGFRETT